MPVSKQKWGTKRVCPSCATKFYDFDRTPLICPKCETEFDPESLLKTRRPRPSAAAKAVKPAVIAKPKAKVEELDEDVEIDIETDEDLEDLADGDDDDEAVLDDDADLDDDVPDVVVSPDEVEDR